MLACSTLGRSVIAALCLGHSAFWRQQSQHNPRAAVLFPWTLTRAGLHLRDISAQPFLRCLPGICALGTARRTEETEAWDVCKKGGARTWRIWRPYRTYK